MAALKKFYDVCMPREEEKKNSSMETRVQGEVSYDTYINKVRSDITITTALHTDIPHFCKPCCCASTQDIVHIRGSNHSQQQ